MSQMKLRSLASREELCTRRKLNRTRTLGICPSAIKESNSKISALGIVKEVRYFIFKLIVSFYNCLGKLHLRLVPRIYNYGMTLFLS